MSEPVTCPCCGSVDLMYSPTMPSHGACRMCTCVWDEDMRRHAPPADHQRNMTPEEREAVDRAYWKSVTVEKDHSALVAEIDAKIAELKYHNGPSGTGSAQDILRRCREALSR